MFQKEIIYVSLYKNGNRLGSAGFLKVESRDTLCRFFLKLQNMPQTINGRFPIRIYNGTDWKEIDGITVRNGCGVWEESTGLDTEQIRLQILLPEGYLAEGQKRTVCGEMKAPHAMQTIREPIHQPVTVHEESKEETELDAQDMSPETFEKRELLTAESEEITMPQSGDVKEDKWEQILSSYDQIHPYGDDRTYVKIEPKDFIILQSKYQHLVNNSFLLHGFYNYRYVILGKEDDYYLGVPGVFYKREKMVALMFGFEAFECEDGVAEEGKFGYYLRKVEL